MSMIQAVAKKKLEQKNSSHDHDATSHQTSPAKTVLGVLAKHQTPAIGPGSDPTGPKGKSKSSHDDLNPKVPESVEDVPFRRQDRRILNARKKRVSDRKLIRFILVCGALIAICGILLLVFWATKAIGDFEQFLIIGGVLIGFGLLIMLFTIEICVRLNKNAKRVRDPEIDKLENLHDLKHWIDPELIPYGWGQPYDKAPCEEPPNYDNAMSSEQEQQQQRRGGHVSHKEKAELASSRGGAGMKGIILADDDTPGSGSPGQNRVSPAESVEEAEPHLAMAIEMQKLSGAEESEEAKAELRTSPIPKDIFDESMRYSDVDRPSKINIEPPSSPRLVKQIRGTFQTEEERIANLFNHK